MTLLRGTIDGADCGNCPFSNIGLPNKPVFSEFPEDPLWLLVGEGPGMAEVRNGRCFIGPSGEVVNKFLAKIGRPRDEIYVGNATLCQPKFGSPPEDRDRAAVACNGRLKRELALFPGKPVLTLGAVAARAIIPKAVFDAIDPPDVPKSKKRAAKDKQKAEWKETKKRGAAIDRIAERRLKATLKYREKQIYADLKARGGAKPDRNYVLRELNQGRATMRKKCWVDAEAEYEQKAEERRLAKIEKQKTKPRKKKPVKITDIMSTTFDVDVDGSGIRPVIPGIHPAALLRGGGATIGGTHAPDLAYINLTYDAAKVDGLARGKDLRLKLNIETEFVDADRATSLFLRVFWLAVEGGECALDLETYVDDPDRHSALMAYKAQIRAIGFATKDLAVSVMWDLLPAWTQSYLQMLLNRCTMVYHHGIYDTTVLRAYGFIIDSIDSDTLLAHHAVFPGCSHKLQQVTAQFFAIAPWKSEFRNSEETPEGLTLYNAKDTGGTLAIAGALAIHVKRNNAERLYEVDRKMASIAGRMHLVGMPIDREVNDELLTTFHKHLVESRSIVEEKVRDPKIREHVFHHLALQEAAKKRKLDPDDFEERYQVRLRVIKDDPRWRWKINSGKHIAALLLAMGVQLSQKTESGQISTKKDVLESLVDVPVVRDIVAFRENDKLYSTFVYPLFDRSVNGEIVQYGYADETSRIHPIWTTHKISGRWASYDPVVSNWAKDKWKKWLLPIEALPPDVIFKVDKLTGDVDILTRPNLRRQVVAPHGRVFVGFDYKQLEAKIIAQISGDEFLCDVFMNKKDVHKACARIVFPNFDQLGEIQQKKARNEVKPLSYALYYNSSDETIWRNLVKEGRNVKLADVTAALNRLRVGMPGVVRWQRESVQAAMRPPYEVVDMVLGRRRCFPLGNIEATEVLNSQAQFAGSAIMNQGMEAMEVKLLAYKQAFPIGQFHDAALIECWENDAPAIQKDVHEAFEQEITRFGRTLFYDIDSRIAKNWAGTD